MDAGHDLAMRLRAAYAALRRRSNDAFVRFGMTSDQFVLLTALVDAGAATQEELVRRCYSDTNTIRAMLILLEQKGFVTRQPHASDGRAWSVRLTEEGRQWQRELWECSEPVRARLLTRFSPDEMQSLLEYLDRIADAMAPPEDQRPRRRKETFL